MYLLTYVFVLFKKYYPFTKMSDNTESTIFFFFIIKLIMKNPNK